MREGKPMLCHGRWVRFIWAGRSRVHLQKMAKCGVKCVLDLGEYISGGGIIHRAVRVVHKHKIL
jgi:hypothetical protein